MEHKLAIVIPAYKSVFFKEALNSIANQTCLDFRLYIGDDNSPENLYRIVEAYESKLDIKYQKFEENFGGSDLVSHWERCINLVQNEKWIWLFSDDDTMDNNCVEKFYHFINTNSNVNLLHFDINIINKLGVTIGKSKNFPKNMSIATFFEKRIKNEINSTVVEYIVEKEAFKKEGGFKNYDLAWSSDDATWIRLARNSGIVTIPDAKVNWRYSDSNITAMVNDKKISIRKLKSNIEHIEWIKGYFLELGIKEKSTEFDKFKWVMSVILLTPIFTLKQKVNYAKDVIKKVRYFKITLKAFIYILYIQVKLKFNL